jgi:hypothetical protein
MNNILLLKLKCRIYYILIVTVLTDRHETYGSGARLMDYHVTSQRDIYSSLTLDSLNSLVLDSQIHSLFSL